LDSQMAPQILFNPDASSVIPSPSEHASFAFPNALITRRYSPIPKRQDVGGINITYPGLRLFEAGLPEQRVTKISVRIAEAVESSRRILDLANDWDEEGSPAYAHDTWKRATQFVLQSAIGYRKSIGVWVSPPKITPGPDGSIDVRWKTSERSVLINFPASDGESVQFFGSDRDTESIRGTLDLSLPNQWILMWLTR
jgi:hypothetical protein